jgi:hypothetical protein
MIEDDMKKLNLPYRFDAVAPEAVVSWVLHLNSLDDNLRDPERGWLISVVWLDLVDLLHGLKGVDVRPLTSDSWVLRYVCEIRRYEGSPLVVYHHCEYEGDREELLRHLQYENGPTSYGEEFGAMVEQLGRESRQPGMKQIAEMKWQTFRGVAEENDRYAAEIRKAYRAHLERLTGTSHRTQEP